MDQNDNEVKSLDLNDNQGKETKLNNTGHEDGRQHSSTSSSFSSSSSSMTVLTTTTTTTTMSTTSSLPLKSNESSSLSLSSEKGGISELPTPEEVLELDWDLDHRDAIPPEAERETNNRNTTERKGEIEVTPKFNTESADKTLHFEEETKETKDKKDKEKERSGKDGTNTKKKKKKKDTLDWLSSSDPSLDGDYWKFDAQTPRWQRHLRRLAEGPEPEEGTGARRGEERNVYARTRYPDIDSQPFDSQDDDYVVLPDEEEEEEEEVEELEDELSIQDESFFAMFNNNKSQENKRRRSEILNRLQEERARITHYSRTGTGTGTSTEGGRVLKRPRSIRILDEEEEEEEEQTVFGEEDGIGILGIHPLPNYWNEAVVEIVGEDDFIVDDQQTKRRKISSASSASDSSASLRQSQLTFKKTRSSVSSPSPSSSSGTVPLRLQQLRVPQVEREHKRRKQRMELRYPLIPGIRLRPLISQRLAQHTQLRLQDPFLKLFGHPVPSPSPSITSTTISSSSFNSGGRGWKDLGELVMERKLLEVLLNSVMLSLEKYTSSSSSSSLSSTGISSSSSELDECFHFTGYLKALLPRIEVVENSLLEERETETEMDTNELKEARKIRRRRLGFIRQIRGWINFVSDKIPLSSSPLFPRLNRVCRFLHFLVSYGTFL
jgi:hypothetical protein